MEILKCPEGKRLEFKPGITSPDRVLRTVVAFANTVGGMLLLGVEDKSRRVRAVGDPLAGLISDCSRIVDRFEVRSLPGRAVEEGLAFVEEHTLYRADIARLRHKDRWSLPPVAVINAVVHTDYAQRGAPQRLSVFDDRLEIENLSLLPFGLTVEDLPHGVSKLRNGVIGRVFHALGLIERWGRGIQRMTASCLEAGLATHVFEELASRFRVTFATARVARPTLDDTSQASLETLADGNVWLTSEIDRAIGSIRTRLARLIGRVLVLDIGTGPQDPKRRYFLTEGGRT